MQAVAFALACANPTYSCVNLAPSACCSTPAPRSDATRRRRRRRVPTCNLRRADSAAADATLACPSTRMMTPLSAGNVLITTTRGRNLRVQRIVFALLLGSALPFGCVVYEPVPTYYPSPPTYDRAWSAALGALQDTGVAVTSADRATGVIRGTRAGATVTVTPMRSCGKRSARACP